MIDVMDKAAAPDQVTEEAFGSDRCGRSGRDNVLISRQTPGFGPSERDPSVIYRDQDWYTIDEAAEALHCSRRTLFRQLSNVSGSVVRPDPAFTGRGRPTMQYHFAATPALMAYHRVTTRERLAEEAPPEEKAVEVKREIAADDLAVARFRAMAVEEFIKLRGIFSKQERLAAKTVCEDWQHLPRKTIARVVQRLPDGHERHTERIVSVGSFSVSTLRGWHGLYIRSGKSLLSLVPARKKSCGRAETDIPEKLLDIVHALAVSTARSDVAKAIQESRSMWPGTFPTVDISTWRRRIKRRDPSRAFAALGKHGIAKFRQTQSPDIERDWSKLRFNQRFELDDTQMDWKAIVHLPEWMELRPYVYAMIRCSTRQWVSYVASPAKITHQQVAAMLGFSLASKGVGIPEEITFERGAVACTDHLEEVLTGLHVKVHRTSMDGGRVHPSAAPDVAKGHFQGKGIVESNIRGLHNTAALVASQVGPEEKRTAQARLPNLMKIALEAKKEGRAVVIPSDDDWHSLIRQMMETFNNQPHGSLPKIVDPAQGIRHMSPNEYARHLQDQSIKVMDERLIPMFLDVTRRMQVTRNGIEINTRSYGRLDEGLQKLHGSFVEVFADPAYPDAVYVKQLGRCVDRYHKADPSGDSDQFHAKRSAEKRLRNGYEAVVDRAMAAAQEGVRMTLKTTQTTSNPTPNRMTELFAPEAMMSQATDRTKGFRDHKAAEAEVKARCTFDGTKPATPPQAAPERRASLLNVARKISDVTSRPSVEPGENNQKKEPEDTWKPSDIMKRPPLPPLP
jgi:hypothetical protein